MKKLFNLSVNQLNQNGYSRNMQTKGKIGALFLFPINHTPNDCLSCDGYSLLIIDYEDLFKVIGTTFNQAGDSDDTFRVPDYNISKRFLQPGNNVGDVIGAGLPDINGTFGAFFYSSNGGTGAFRQYTSVSNRTSNNGSGAGYQNIEFKASYNNSIYGNSLTVQPPSQIVHLCIKYK